MVPVLEQLRLALQQMPLRFYRAPLAAREARNVGVVAGYLATLYVIGMSDSEEGGRGG